MGFDNDSYKRVYSKQTQWEAATKQAASAAAAQGTLLSSWVWGGMVLQCDHPGGQELCPGDWPW